MSLPEIQLPTDFQPLPSRHVLQDVPPDTKVAHIGDIHANLFGRYWFYKDMSAIAAWSKTMAVEATLRQKDSLNYSLDELTGDPATLMDKTLPKSKKNNYFSNVTVGPYSLYKILSSAREHGMDIECVDDAYEDYTFGILSLQGHYRRNSAAAENIARLNGKVAHFGGVGHLYTQDMDVMYVSPIQSFLQDKNINTYTVAVESYADDFISRIARLVDPVTQQERSAMMGAYYSNSYELAHSAPTFFDFRDYTSAAGRDMPDQAVIFSTRSIAILGQAVSVIGTAPHPVFEAVLWDAIGRADQAYNPNYQP